MKETVFLKNKPNWSYKEIVEEVEIFCDLYDKRPIKDNVGGMKTVA